MEQEQIPVDSGTVEVVNTPTPPPVVEKNPLELQAQFFTLYFPKLVQMVHKLSKKQMMRVLLAAVEHPLNDKPFHFTSQLERDCFKIAVQLSQANALMQLVTVTSSSEFDNALDQAVPQDQENNMEQKEEENGKQEDHS